MARNTARAILFAIVLSLAWAAIVYRTRSAEWPRPHDELALKEYRYVGARLEEIQERALRDPALQRLNEVLGLEMQAAMAAVDPGLADTRRTGAALDGPGAGGVAGAAEAELRELDRRFLQAQEKALLRPDLAEQVRLFHLLLRRRMIQEDAAADSLLARFQALSDQLGLSAGPFGR